MLWELPLSSRNPTDAKSKTVVPEFFIVAAKYDLSATFMLTSVASIRSAFVEMLAISFCLNIVLPAAIAPEMATPIKMIDVIAGLTARLTVTDVLFFMLRRFNAGLVFGNCVCGIGK